MHNRLNKFDIPFKGTDKYLFYFLLAIPAINSIADSTLYYFVVYGEVQGLHPGTIRGALLLLFTFLFGFRRISKDRQCILIMIFLGYIFICTLFSSNVMYSFLLGYVKWFVPLLMYPVGLYFIRNYDLFLKLNISIIIGALMVCINLIVAQIGNYGMSVYVEDTFYIGGAGVGITNQLAIILLTYPFLLRLKRNKLSKAVWLLFYFVGLVSIVFIFIAMKRAAIICLITGLLICLYFARKKILYIKYIIISLIFFFSIYLFIEPIFIQRTDVRMEQMKNIENEGRYREIFYALDEFNDADVLQKLFGKEIFYTVESFGRKYFNSGRMIHSDLVNFFYGGGLIGFVLYILIYISLFQNGLRCRTMLKPYGKGEELLMIYFAILCGFFLISVTGSGTIGERSLVFLCLGGIMGVLKTLIKDSYSNTRLNGSISTDINLISK